MAGSVNKVILVGNLGADPEVRRTQDGKAIVNLRIATSESWRDKNTGDRKEKHEITIPGSEKVVQAKFLEGAEPTWTDDKGAREILADWITSRDNPFFAKATVNRVWATFFGSGLVEPIDEMVGSAWAWRRAHPDGYAG